ncbi:phage tail protein [Paenibacillus sp. AK121]|uniref:phage tail protein n=1 Tax=Paenibacillus sp. AK121 TaxID=2849670 RepID=UPI001C251221|nr:phage tail protein [Paenibacillus sp. AK121]MBU9705933.1 phage tail protein [Paenibacillus sp. AK121]
MANTDKLNLPLIEPNMTADVPRDMNALAEAIDAKAGVAGGLAVLGADGKVPAGQLNVKDPVDASTTVKGIVQLTNATNSTSETLAPTAKALKTANDRANEAYNRADQAFTQASDLKSKVANAITGKGGNANSAMTGDQLAAAILALSVKHTASGNLGVTLNGIRFGESKSLDIPVDFNPNTVLVKIFVSGLKPGGGTVSSVGPEILPIDPVGTIQNSQISLSYTRSGRKITFNHTTQSVGVDSYYVYVSNWWAYE